MSHSVEMKRWPAWLGRLSQKVGLMWQPHQQMSSWPCPSVTGGRCYYHAATCYLKRPTKTPAMEEQLIALEVPPRTLDVQQFAKARAAELLSLHTVLKKKKKRKASSISSSHGELQDIGDGDVNEDDVGHSHTFTSLPRHLRRRTSSYTRRRRPLPWLYKKKRKSPSSSSPSVSLPTNWRKCQRKRRQSQAQNHSAALPSQLVGDGWEGSVISSRVGVDGISSMGGDDIAVWTSRSCHGFQQEIAAPLQQPKIQADQQNFPQLHQQKLPDCGFVPSFQPQEENRSLRSHVRADGTDVNEIAALAQVDTHELQQQLPFEVDVDGIALRSVDGVGTTASLQVGCNKEASAYGATSMDLDGVPTSVETGSHQVHEGAMTLPSRDDNVSMGEDDLAAPARAGGHVAQEEAVQQEENSGALVQAHGHKVQLEAFAITPQVRESIAPDYTAALAQVDSNPVQRDGIYLASQVKGEGISPMHIDGVAAPTQGDNLEIEHRATNIKKKKKVCRALRRLIEFKPGSSLISSDGTRRLGTHVWHAKRFAMEKKWGYRIPLGRPGRGHGSRAVLRWSKDKALLHDSSFINAIQLHGKEEEIMNLLRLVLELPQGLDRCLKPGQTLFSWRDFTSAILHHAGQAPYKIISSVILMWKPVTQELSIHTCAAKCNEDSKEQDLWLWVHAAAFEEAFQALKDICCQLNKEAKEERVNCFSRRGDLGRLDLIGQESFAVLEKVLFPVYRDLQSKCIALHELAEVVNPTHVKGNTVVHMEVCDPRLKQSERCLALDPTLIPSVTAFEDKSSISQELLEKANKFVEGEIEPAQETLEDLSRNMEGALDHCYSNDSIDALWACEAKPFQRKIGPPVKEKFLSKMRHTDRLDTFGFIQESVKINRMLERRKNLSGRFRCPVILLKHDHDKASARGWSVILPLSWISAFWVPLVFAGGHVIGIRERHWLYTDAGTPSFPDDFPDSKAYTELKAAESLQGTEAVHKKFTRKGLPGSSQTSESNPGKALHGPFGQCPTDPSIPCAIHLCEVGNRCLVVRTSERLVSYLRVTHQTGLLLFPAQKQIKEKFKGLGRCLHEGIVAWHARSQTQETRTMNSDQVVCLLRVSIRPFQKGVVEVGAMVYAPTSEDYTQWSCMEKPPMMHSLDRSERAIGYVTSMAPRGSKVRAGIAFCNAVALGLARGRQWVETTWHKNSEIFLLFCNKGSSTFRPAFASICLETGPDI